MPNIDQILSIDQIKTEKDPGNNVLFESESSMANYNTSSGAFTSKVFLPLKQLAVTYS